ncbi:MAG: DUF2220 family protein [Opitutaceae bacterium]|nr:DUF2220 family protein [Opitutaceae bacterium]
METRLVLNAVEAALTAGRSQVDSEAVFNALVERMPHLRSDPDRWELFVELLIAAESEDLIVLPSRDGSGWLQTVTPARPKWIRLPTRKEPKDGFDHRSFPWNPSLSFLGGERILPKGVRDAALSIQRFLAEGGASRSPAPIKERSFDIFGDEKRLEGLQHSTILFGTGRVGLELLRCFVVSPTPVAERFALGTGILILENEATFDSFCRLCRHKSVFGLVVYGRGHEIQKCAAYLRREADKAGAAEISYFGDVDRRGLEIPRQLALNAEIGARVRPLVIAYEAILRQTPVSTQPIPACCDWLPPELASRAATIVLENRRLPQEAFGWDEIAVLHQLDVFLR